MSLDNLTQEDYEYLEQEAKKERAAVRYDRSSPDARKIFSIRDSAHAEYDSGLRFGEIFSARAKRDRELWNKIATTLVPGQRYNSYAALCSALGLVPAQGGRNRQLQENRIKKFVDYSVDTLSGITINKIGFDAADASGKYLTLLQDILILSVLQGQETNQFDPEHIICYEVPRSQLYLILGMQNPALQQIMMRVKDSLQQNTQLFERLKEYSPQSIADACYVLNHKDNRIISDMLVSMQNRGLLAYTQRLRYFYHDYKFYGTDLATRTEASEVEELEDQVLKLHYGLNPDQKHLLFYNDSEKTYELTPTSRWFEYQQLCQKTVNKQFGWTGYRWNYQIFFYPSDELLSFASKFSGKSQEELFQLYAECVAELNKKIFDYFTRPGKTAFGRCFEDEVVRNKFAKLLIDIKGYAEDMGMTVEEYCKSLITFDNTLK